MGDANPYPHPHPHPHPHPSPSPSPSPSPRWETRVAINYSMLALCRSLTYYIVLAHWSACALKLPTTFYEPGAHTWIISYGYGSSSPLQVYVASLYLCLQVICGAAGGDMEEGVFSTQEQLLFSVLVVMGVRALVPRTRLASPRLASPRLASPRLDSARLGSARLGSAQRG